MLRRSFLAFGAVAPTFTKQLIQAYRATGRVNRDSVAT